MNSAGIPNHAGHDGTTYNTALRGAFLAFQKTPTPTAKPTTGSSPSTPTPAPSHDVSNSRLAHSPSLSRQTTGKNSTLGRDHSLASHRLTPQHTHLAIGQGSLLTPTKSTPGDPRSPSLIAATLATSRSASPSPKAAPSLPTSAYQAAREHRKGNVGDGSTVSSVTDLDLTTDSSSIGPTNALISLFERKEDEVDPVKKSPAAPGVKKGPKIGLRPMTPPRTMSPVVTYEASPSRLASSVAWEKAVLSSPSAGREIVRIKSPLRNAEGTEPPVLKPAKKPRPATPPPKTNHQVNTVILSPQPRQASSHKVVTDPTEADARSATPPTRSIIHQTRPPRTTVPPVTSFVAKQASGTLIRRSSSSLSNDTFVSASSAPSPQSDSSHRENPRRLTPEALRPLRPASVHPVPKPPPPRPPTRQSASQLPLDSLTNAIVAGSLASARATPTTKPPTPPPPRKQTPHMRQTLRAPRAKSEEELNGVGPQHKKKPLGKLSSRKKHAHHEGARHRWREEITAREKQRYEGVWASNRGLLLDGPSGVANGLRNTDTGQLVANIIVRDIWARSRLPFDELAEVWDLVDGQGKGALDKPQFVVGMWLIDQRLRGRKIPRKVSDSVWGSAKGVRVPGPERK
ncbi:hypothetical protein NUW58_g5837 [Xylaria curta]|uniref:Uncharacterized protein n=1 Tax=Xylaria curta TaxID=42375 RepID=A0ACC1P1B4_9PEZI|nr:hypothetical protein NUW58_g5837 [Xylaria curta]